MAEEILASVQVRRDNKANWEAVNPILLDGEAAYEKDTDMFKIGDGVNNYKNLPYHNKVGPKGDDGADGKTAYAYAQEGGYTGTEVEFAAKLAQEMPTALPNPQPITINGQRYDGSEAVTMTTVEIDDTMTQSGKAADAKAVGDQLSALNEAIGDKVSKPSVADDGKIPRAKEGEVEWVEVGQPTDEQINSAVSSWLTEHPEATTTVQDESIEEIKINKNFLPWIKNDYVTPEMFGAFGDGVHDDTSAFKEACKTKLKLVLQKNKTYIITDSIDVFTDYIDGNNSTIVVKDSATTKNGIGVFFLKNSLTLKDIKIYATLDNWYRPEGFYIFNDVYYKGTVALENVFVELNSTSSTKNYHIYNGASPTLKINNCKLLNLSTGDACGVIWVNGQHYKDTNKMSVIITNSFFENTASSEILSFYKADGTVKISNCELDVYDGRYSNSVNIACYDGKIDLIISNSKINYKSDDAKYNRCFIRVRNGSSLHVSNSIFKNGKSHLFESDELGEIFFSNCLIEAKQLLDGYDYAKGGNVSCLSCKMQLDTFISYHATGNNIISNCQIKVKSNLNNDVATTMADGRSQLNINNCIIEMENIGDFNRKSERTYKISNVCNGEYFPSLVL